MENKQYLESQYNINFSSALNYAKQGNLEDSLAAFKRALDSIIRIMKITFGQEQANYRQKADQIVESIKKVESEIEKRKSVASANKQSSGAKPKAAKKEEEPKKEQPPKEKIPVEQALAKLNELVGLTEVKEEVRSLIAELEIDADRKSQGLVANKTNHHIVFAGSPGTGKTTVARIMADILYSIGIIEKGQLVEVGRKDLVAGYVGQTAIKTQEKIEEAMGGVLFIDEIYRLAEGGQNDFGKEAVGEILTAVENCRGDFVAILAGYESNMKEFFDMNDGLPSRFPTTLHFADYNASEMYEIFKGMCEKGQFIISEAAHSKIKMALERMYANRDPVKFGNAREVRNLFERVQKNLKLRLYNDKKAGHTLTTNDLMTILEQDVPAM